MQKRGMPRLLGPRAFLTGSWGSSIEKLPRLVASFLCYTCSITHDACYDRGALLFSCDISPIWELSYQKQIIRRKTKLLPYEKSHGMAKVHNENHAQKEIRILFFSDDVEG